MKTLFDNKKVKFQILDDNQGFIKLSFMNDSVLIVVESDSGELLTIKQKRSTSDIEKYEFPSGGIEPGEEPIEAALRELNEETGYTCDLKKVGVVRPLHGIVDLKVHVFVGSNCKMVDNRLQQEVYEKIEIEFLQFERIKSLILNDENGADSYLMLGLSYHLLTNKKQV